VNLTSPRVFESTTDIFISTPAAGLDVSTLVAGSTFSQQRVKSYAEIINSPMTLQPVIDKLKLSLSASELSRMVRSSAPVDTVIIKISVKNTDAYLASLLANAIARQFEITATNLEITDGAGSAQVKVSTVRESVPSIYPISPKTKLNYLFALVFAFLTTIGLGLLREIFDQTVKNESHISKPLLGVIDFDPEASNQPICYNNVYSSRSESYRQIRVNVLDYLDKHKLKTIAISSSISGEGKSSFSGNLASFLGLIEGP
jgi:non-specific protein-tyrosine kinase